MRSRLAVLTLGLYLSCAFLACSKKPDQSTDTTQPPDSSAQTQPAQAPPMQAQPKAEPKRVKA
jgi:glucose/arabinose dehydrogenase